MSNMDRALIRLQDGMLACVPIEEQPMMMKRFTEVLRLHHERNKHHAELMNKIPELLAHARKNAPTQEYFFIWNKCSEIEKLLEFHSLDHI